MSRDRNYWPYPFHFFATAVVGFAAAVYLLVSGDPAGAAGVAALSCVMAGFGFMRRHWF
jgi:hypothetical protein